jgi:hypothetical protein
MVSSMESPVLFYTRPFTPRQSLNAVTLMKKEVETLFYFIFEFSKFSKNNKSDFFSIVYNTHGLKVKMLGIHE